MRHIRELLTNPKKVAEELARFGKNTRKMARVMRQLARKFPNQYLAYSEGKQLVLGTSLSRLLEETDRRGYPRDNLVVVYLTTRSRTLILPSNK